MFLLSEQMFMNIWEHVQMLEQSNGNKSLCGNITSRNTSKYDLVLVLDKQNHTVDLPHPILIYTLLLDQLGMEV